MIQKIALNYYAEKHEEFVEAIKAVGGEAIRLRYGDFLNMEAADIKKRLEEDKISGLILTGGPDIQPERYNCKVKDSNLKEMQINLMGKERDKFDFELIEAAWGMELPILAVCLGPQELNVYKYNKPDSLRQHIYGHRNDEDKNEPKVHPINIVKETKLHKIIGKDTVQVASYHHQAIGTSWEKFTVSARADGVIEAIEYRHDSGGWVLGVQWHPERMLERPEQKRLFSALLEEAKDYASKKYSS